jgi:vacuolar-type H+-ATPase subunit F/Vma7
MFFLSLKRPPAMPAPVFIGDEAAAAGFRLAGARSYSPDPERLPFVFRRALAEAELVLIAVDYARRLPAAEINAAQAAMHPLLLVVPDLAGLAPMRDLLVRLRTQLGVGP